MVRVVTIDIIRARLGEYGTGCEFRTESQSVGAGEVVRLRLSECFEGFAGRLIVTRVDAEHVPAERRVEHFRLHQLTRLRQDTVLTGDVDTASEMGGKVGTGEKLKPVTLHGVATDGRIRHRYGSWCWGSQSGREHLLRGHGAALRFLYTAGHPRADGGSRLAGVQPDSQCSLGKCSLRVSLGNFTTADIVRHDERRIVQRSVTTTLGHSLELVAHLAQERRTFGGG